MKSIIILCLFAVAAVAYAKPGQYTNKYDNVDLDEILNNHRLFGPYMKCMLDQGKCTPEGKELKSHISEALAENCAKCTDAQRAGTRKVMSHLINKDPESWAKLKAKYDSKGIYASKYEQELRTLKA